MPGSDLFVTAETTPVTITNNPAEGDLVVFRIFRDVSDAGDDLDIDARLIGVQIFFNTDQVTFGHRGSECRPTYDSAC